jgi:hypothetical protein
MRHCGCKPNLRWVLCEVTLPGSEVGTARPPTISADNWSRKPLCNITRERCNLLPYASVLRIKQLNIVIQSDLDRTESLCTTLVTTNQTSYSASAITIAIVFNHSRCWLYGSLPARRSGLLMEIQTETSSLSQMFCTSMTLFVQNTYSGLCSTPRNNQCSIKYEDRVIFLNSTHEQGVVYHEVYCLSYSRFSGIVGYIKPLAS